MTYCDCHSGVKKNLENLEHAHNEDLASITKAHKRLDDMEKEKVSVGTLQILVTLFILMFGAAFGYQTYKLRTIDEIDKCMAVLQNTMRRVEHTVDRLEQR